jgi:hypothetical protein
MDKIANPLDSIIDFAWASGADLFFVNNAKDELKRLREEVEKTKTKTKEWVQEVYKANQFAVEQTNEYLSVCDKIQQISDALGDPVAYARTNDKGDLYDLRLQNNPYNDQTTVIPLFRIKNG